MEHMGNYGSMVQKKHVQVVNPLFLSPFSIDSILLGAFPKPRRGLSGRLPGAPPPCTEPGASGAEKRRRGGRGR